MNLWHDAGRVGTCPSGYEPDHGDAHAEERPSDFAREVPEGTRYVVKSVAAQPPFPGTFSCHLVLNDFCSRWPK